MPSFYNNLRRLAVLFTIAAAAVSFGWDVVSLVLNRPLVGVTSAALSVVFGASLIVLTVLHAGPAFRALPSHTTVLSGLLLSGFGVGSVSLVRGVTTLCVPAMSSVSSITAVTISASDRAMLTFAGNYLVIATVLSTFVPLVTVALFILKRDREDLLRVFINYLSTI